MNDDLAAHLRSLEEELLQPDTRSDPKLVASYLADDFREFGSSGRIFTKPEILPALAAESPRPLTLTDFACTELAPGVALVTYCSRATSDTGSREALRSSVWVLRSGRWQVLFHQGTRT
jgi:hypothetical protein